MPPAPSSPPSRPHPGRPIPSIAAHLGLCGTSGVLLALAFPQPGWWALAHVALVPAAILAVRSPRAWRLAWTAYVVGLLWWLARISWLIPVTFGGYVGLAAYMAVYFPAALLLVRWIARSYPALGLVLILPMAWVSLEWIRGVFLQGGFGWFALGHSQAAFREDQSPGLIVQCAALFGHWTVGFLVAMTNGLIADVLTKPLVSVRSRRGAGPSGALLSSAMLWAGAYGGALWYGLATVHPDAAGRGRSTVRVAVVQTNVPQDQKVTPTVESILATWKSTLNLTRQAAAASPPPVLIVWPETIVPAALNDEALAHYRRTQSAAVAFDQELRRLARSLEVSLLVGAFAEADYRTVRDHDGSKYHVPARRHNSAFLYTPHEAGDVLRYDKVHRVPFGEYVPWVDHWPWLKRQFIHYLTPYDFDYSIRAGQGYRVFPVQRTSTAGRETTGGPSGDGVLRVAAPICFEDSIARVGRAMVYGAQGSGRGAKGVDLLVNLTNDGWYGGRQQRAQHFQVAVLRCIENRVPMARSVNTGISGFISSRGKVGPLVRVGDREQHVEGTAIADVVLDPAPSLFGRVGQGPVLGLLAATGLLALGGGVRRRGA